MQCSTGLLKTDQKANAVPTVVHSTMPYISEEESYLELAVLEMHIAYPGDF